MSILKVSLTVVLTSIASLTFAQDTNLRLLDWHPVSQLKVSKGN